MMQQKWIDQMLASYVETMLWSTTDQSDESGGVPLDENYSVDDISDDAMATMMADVRRFAEQMADVILSAEVASGSLWGMAGHDFWLTRNGHGAGFWDGDWEPQSAADALTAAAKAFGEQDPYVGDDGRIYLG